jgi:hypothetical protein
MMDAPQGPVFWSITLLEYEGLHVGVDYHWAWNHATGCMAIEFNNPEYETVFRLKYSDHILDRPR